MATTCPPPEGRSHKSLTAAGFFAARATHGASLGLLYNANSRSGGPAESAPSVLALMQQRAAKDAHRPLGLVLTPRRCYTGENGAGGGASLSGTSHGRYAGGQESDDDDDDEVESHAGEGRRRVVYRHGRIRVRTPAGKGRPSSLAQTAGLQDEVEEPGWVDGERADELVEWFREMAMAQKIRGGASAAGVGIGYAK